MLLLLPLPFLAVGCLCFVLCAAAPPARRYALPLALWFATWGVLFAGDLGLLLIAVIGLSFAKQEFQLHPSGPLGAMSWGAGPIIYLLVLISAAGIAAGITLLHGMLLRRITFELFRVYLGAVASGVGLLSATPATFAALGALQLSQTITVAVAVLVIPFLAAALCWLCLSNATDFRGKRPERFNPIAPTEYSSGC